MNTDMSDEERDAIELFPHTRVCIDRIRQARVVHPSLECSCKAASRRRTFLYLIRRAKDQSYTDAYAKIRHRAKMQAEQAREPAQRAAYEVVMEWAEHLELGHLKE